MYCILHECYLAIVELMHTKNPIILFYYSKEKMFTFDAIWISCNNNCSVELNRKKVSHLKSFEKQAILKSFSTSFVDQS